MSKLYSYDGTSWVEISKNGINGVNGTNGQSAYDLAVSAGYVGSQASWLASLKGADGYTPVKNVDYFDGTNGTNGTNGSNGVGVPTGGTTGQVLAKNSNTSYDDAWITPPSTINGYTYQNYENLGTYVYVGYSNATTSAWYIYRRTIATNIVMYASGGSSYSTNWTNHSSLTYV